jgi:hypothetical protein
MPKGFFKSAQIFQTERTVLRATIGEEWTGPFDF